jgi:hypothetical protein
MVATDLEWYIFKAKFSTWNLCGFGLVQYGEETTNL